MSPKLLNLYHRLPPFLRSCAASMRGYQLARWRYGPETEGLVAEALERETWTSERWRHWQQEELARLLHRAARKVPYYRELWNKRRRKGDHSSAEVLENWPILSKEEVRVHPKAFLAEDCDTRRMFADHTSGTTGTPLTIWLSRASVRLWYALHEARTRCWHGVKFREPWGLIGGQPVASPRQTKPPFWVWNCATKQLYLSAMHVAPWSASSYLEAISSYNLKLLLGYPSSLHYLAREAKAAGLSIPLAAVVSNAEPLHPYQRQVISEVFQCQMQETYGLAEAVCMASECRSGNLHLWPDTGLVEILDGDGLGIANGTAGRIVATGLINSDMPLIRYDTRDRGQFHEKPLSCSCGRGMPILKKVWGRWDDVILTQDGRIPVLLDRIFDPPVHVKEGQIVQQAIGQFKIRVVPAPGWTHADEDLLRNALIDLVGEARITVELTSRMETTWAGKARILVSEIQPSVSVPDNIFGI